MVVLALPAETGGEARLAGDHGRGVEWSKRLEGLADEMLHGFSLNLIHFAYED